MTNASETVREVCAEMQDARHLSKPAIDEENHLLSDRFYDDECQGWLSFFAKRILSAHEREMAAVVAERDAEIRRRALLEREMAAKDARIALLERALKPVMECTINDWEGGGSSRPCCGCDFSSQGCEEDCLIFKIHESVKEAKRIMKEGEEK